MKKPEEAREYLFSSLADIINHTIRTMSGLAFMYAEWKDETCISAALWLADFFDSLKEDGSKITFLDKLKAILLAQCAVWKASWGCLEEAEEYIAKAYALAKEFDASPIYTMQGVKFFKGMEEEGISFDGIGKTALEAVENFVFNQNVSTDACTYVKNIWEDLKNG